MKKIICFLILTSTVFALLITSASAAEENFENIPNENSAESVTSSDDTSEGNTADEIYGLVIDNIGEIFAFLACAFSGILMLCYKKGILPLIKGGIGALSGGVTALSEEAKKQSESSNGISAMLEEKLKLADTALSKMNLSLTLMEEKLNSSEENKKDSEVLKTILLEEVNMLYEVFMAATLPEYQKERISKEVGAMKEKLTSLSGGENEEN